MSRIKSKLVFTVYSQNYFKIAMSVNTVEYGVPGDSKTREEIDKLLKDNEVFIKRGELTVEFVYVKED